MKRGEEEGEGEEGGGGGGGGGGARGRGRRMRVGGVVVIMGVIKGKGGWSASVGRGCVEEGKRKRVRGGGAGGREVYR